MHAAADYIRQYQMQPHPEGGYYAPMYRSSIKTGLPGEDERDLYSSIYFLFIRDNFSAFHRLRSDELWHWHDGDSIVVTELLPDGKLRTTLLGRETGIFQYRLEAGVWFAGHCEGPAGFALMGCTVHPGFTFADFELAKRAHLLKKFPQHSDIIRSYTRG